MFRIQKGWKIADLAQHAKMPREVISKIENLKRTPTLWDMTRIAQALGIDSRILFPEKKDEWWERLKQEALEQGNQEKQKKEGSEELPPEDVKLADAYY